ncbi:MAG: Hsp70 family protein [Caldilineaceae bacterium]
MTDITYAAPAQNPSDGPRYAIGIDLGTTNSAVAYVDLQDDQDAARRPIRLFNIPQLVAPGEVAARPVLPSFLYLPGAYDLPAGAAALPWDEERDYIVGELAREQGARVPGRLIASAKSWLSHSRVDRSAAILPWGADEGVPQVSPVEASSRYLQHIREAWNARMVPAESVGEEAASADALRFDAQQVILTVPASFDEVARELTLQAARDAGLAHAILLEEPLAAFYAWLARHEVDWQQRMRDGQIILVCDVGGGTTDFTLVGIRAGASGLRFDRLAVGEHLMLGGDNMDYTLGRKLETRLFERPGALDTQRWHQLVFQCRSAKETLLGADDDAPDRVEVTVTGTGSALVGGTRSGSLTREEVQRLILDGFFPQIALDDLPAESRRGGLTELGLPYEQEPAIPRHLASFWNRFEGLLRRESGREHVYPDFILFNGGALTPTAIRGRLLAQIGGWFDAVAGESWQPEELHNPHPELAVARGAAYYGLVRQGLGVRVGSGSPRTYYVGVGRTERDNTQTAVCLVPRGTEEGFHAQLDELDFEARTNQPVEFQILASSTRTEDALGQVVELPSAEVTELPPIRTVLRFGRSGEARTLPVTLGVHLTEVGTLALYCASRQTDHRWQLQFDVRESAAAGTEGQSVEETLEQAAVEAAQSVITDTFSSGLTKKSLPPESLRHNLEEMLALPKEHWPTPLIRALADTLLETAQGRQSSPEHEARWLNMLGFCLRPGYGDPLDEWRMKRTWKLFFEGPVFPRQGSARNEWWIFWRRIGGGLNAGQQNELFQLVRPYLQPANQRKTPRLGLPKHISGGEMLEVWMMLGNLERLPADMKAQIGDTLLSGMGDGSPRARELWSLSRIGARTPLYGPVDRALPGEKAAAWLKFLMALELEPNDATAQALVLMARRTGDRVRDLPAARWEPVSDWLAALPHGERWIELLRNPTSSLRHEEEEWIFGESMPSGLVLSVPAAE